VEHKSPHKRKSAGRTRFAGDSAGGSALRLLQHPLPERLRRWMRGSESVRFDGFSRTIQPRSPGFLPTIGNSRTDYSRLMRRARPVECYSPRAKNRTRICDYLPRLADHVAGVQAHRVALSDGIGDRSFAHRRFPGGLERVMGTGRKGLCGFVAMSRRISRQVSTNPATFKGHSTRNKFCRQRARFCLGMRLCGGQEMPPSHAMLRDSLGLPHAAALGVSLEEP
jgi:hypothetical protein